jgi:hypothetical protein
MGTFTAEAEIAPRRFTADAWVMSDGRWRHHRVRDHFGPEDTKYIVLEANAGKYMAGTPVHYIIEDLVLRIEALEKGNREFRSFTVDAFLAVSGTWGLGFLTADASIFDTITGTLTADAVITKGGSLTASARFAGRITAEAFIV